MVNRNEEVEKTNLGIEKKNYVENKETCT